MSTTKDSIAKELGELYNDGVEVLLVEAGEIDKAIEKASKGTASKKGARTTHANYQRWYSKALPAVKQLLPERYKEFQELYRIETKRASIDFLTYTISDYYLGLSITRGGTEVVNDLRAFTSKYQSQLTIVKSAIDRLDSLLADIQAVLQAALFDDELSVASELLLKKHLRAAGAVAGVTLERHLGQVAVAHNITLRKADPTIGDLDEALKNAGVLDVPNWRFIQRLGDIRNLCVHSKQREPTTDEVDELIRGTEKMIKTLF